MPRVCLMHQNGTVAAVASKALRSAGFTVEYRKKFETRTLRAYRRNPPDVFVIDLSRLPSHGREVAVALRQSPKTRHVPLVFWGGLPEKVKAVRDLIPDAAYCDDAGLVEAVKSAKPRAEPVKPVAVMDRYGSRTVAEKLGIKPGTTVTAIDAPANIDHVLNAEWVEQNGAVILCFAHSVDGLRTGLSHLRTVAHKSKCWILWRKKTAIGHNGITEPLVRETGIGLGLVDYKICAFDENWSAMLFAKKK